MIVSIIGVGSPPSKPRPVKTANMEAGVNSEPKRDSSLGSRRIDVAVDDFYRFPR